MITFQADAARIPRWFERRIDFYIRLEIGDRAKDTRLSEQEFLKYRAERASKVWTIIQRFHLGQIRSLTLLDLCWNYGRARIMGVRGFWNRVGTIEKEQREKAKALLATMRKLLAQIRHIRNDANSDDLGKRILAGYVGPASWSWGPDPGKSNADNSEYPPSILDVFKVYFSRDVGAFPQLELALEHVASEIDCRLNEQRRSSFSFRAHCLLGSELKDGDGMVSLATDCYGKTDFKALAEIVRILHPGLTGLKDIELAREVERCRATPG